MRRRSLEDRFLRRPGPSSRRQWPSHFKKGGSAVTVCTRLKLSRMANDKSLPKLSGSHRNRHFLKLVQNQAKKFNQMLQQTLKLVLYIYRTATLRVSDIDKGLSSSRPTQCSFPNVLGIETSRYRGHGLLSESLRRCQRRMQCARGRRGRNREATSLA